MIQITTTNPSEIVINGPETLEAWRKTNTHPVPGHEFTPRFRRHQWDGLWAPGKWCRQRGADFEMACSRGLARRVVQDLGGSVDFNVASAEEISEFKWHLRHKVELLRDYQLRAIEGVLREGWARVAYATNAGKGAVIGLLARYAQRNGKGVLILCDEIAVFDALRSEIIQWADIPPEQLGLVRSGVKVPPSQFPLISLAMVQTLSRRLDSEKKAKHKLWHSWLLGKEMVLLDEADKADSASWRGILKTAKNSVWRAGFSGSFPTDLFYDLKFDELMGPIIDRVTNAEMVDRGISAKPTIEVHSFNGSSSVASFPKTWWEMTPPEQRTWVYDVAIGLNDHRHRFIASLIRPLTPTAVVVNRIEHGLSLARTIPGAVFLDGSASENERIEVLEDFRLGKIHVVVVTKILDRGTNRLGNAEDLIFASGEGSATQTLQRIGRGLRRANGKEFLRLVDIVDHIVAQRADKRAQMAAGFLQAAARRRLEVYATEGFEVQVKV